MVLTKGERGAFGSQAACDWVWLSSFGPVLALAEI